MSELSMKFYGKEDQCSHEKCLLWKIGARYFARCEECGLASEEYYSTEEAWREGRQRLVQTIHPGV